MWKYTIREFPDDFRQVWVRIIPDSGVPGIASFDSANGVWNMSTGNTITDIYKVARWKYK